MQTSLRKVRSGGRLRHRHVLLWLRSLLMQTSLRKVRSGGRLLLYALVGSCEQAGLRDPWHYLRDVLHKLSQGWLHSRLDDLLPLHWQASQAR